MPFDAAFFADPYAVWARLRNTGSVHRVAAPDGSPIWLVTHERDVRAALVDPRLSVNKAHGSLGYKGFTLPPALDANLLNLDHDDHGRLRRLVSKAFTARRIEQLRARITAHTTQLADQLATGEPVDLVTDYARPIPLTVISDLFDVPQHQREPWASWTTSMLTPQYPNQVSESVAHIHRFLIELVAQRRSTPGDDLLSALIAARDNDDRLDENELVSLAFLILWAGIENATHLISSGVLVLLQHPDQTAELRTQPQLWPAAVQELMRYAHADQVAIRRFPLEDVEIGGASIPAGETVMLALASANRDPARFPDPDRFDIHRPDNPHLALGHGAHYCLGASLARMEVQIGLSTLLERFPNLTLAVHADELHWRQSWRSHALTALPVTL